MKNFFKKCKYLFSSVHIILMFTLAVGGVLSHSKLKSALSYRSEGNNAASVGQYVPASLDSETEAVLSLVSEGSRFVTTNQQFSVVVYLDTQTAINAIEISILFPKENLELLRVSKDDSIIVDWVQEPSVSAERGVITFAGVVHGNGFQGEGKLLTMVFGPTAPGKVLLNFEDASLLTPNDPAIDVLGDKRGTTYFIRKKGLPTPDLNDDDVVDTADIKILTSYWGETHDARYDLNQDGVVNLVDFNILSSMYEK